MAPSARDSPPRGSGAEDASKALVQNTSASFQQQGQFDWFLLAKATASWTVSIIARLSAAGVDPYTVLVAQNLCQLFKLALEGRRNMRKSLDALPSISSTGNMLWFGFGAKHVIRELSTTDQGMLCVALCAALSSCYHESIAAEVMTKSWRSVEPPMNLLHRSTNGSL